ncbi:post-GPI attachment to proteins factor 3-like [Chenopodium quinoa]|uniref:Post-GPI attachment to proteins factor 3 n=1 Tax=Chenopodium quinoa TaxID=63459 RepID=A0A803L651_CHEQI|nr:post-GPI attachment to proteins factor 3-like [Chenopodium quinoa]
MALFDGSVFLFASLLFLSRGILATSGDCDPIYKTCVEQCQKTGCIQNKCFNNCGVSLDNKPAEGPWYLQEPLYLRWKEWDCRSDCRYHCMLSREEERAKLGDKPIKYHKKWPFHRVYGIQEPVSVALSLIILGLIFHGWVSFFILLYYKLPLKPNRKCYYEYTGLWLVYAILSMNSWFWSAVFHGRYVELTENLYYSSRVALLGFSLIISIIRSLNVTTEAARVMVAAPLIAFVTTHILFLNLVELDYGLNMVVMVVIATAQLLFWTICAIRSHQPSRWKLLVVVVGGGISLLLEIIDFPPYKGFIDAHAFWKAISVPLTYILWSFVCDDAEFTTSTLIKKAK